MPIDIAKSIIWKFHDDTVKGVKRVFEMHTDHNGDIYEHRYPCPLDHDTDQALLDWVPVLEASLISSEKESYQKAIEEGADPATIVTKHLTNPQKLKRLVMALMKGDDRKVLKALDFIDSLTSAQRQTAIELLPAEKKAAIIARFKQLRDNRTYLDNDLREEL